MRVTNGMIINTSLNGLYNNMNALNKTYAQMVTGKKIQTVSDDPIIAGRALKLTTTVLETNQYEANTKEAMSWMEVTDAALDNMTEILKSVRTKCVQASTGTLSTENLNSITTDLEQLWKQLQDEANATYGGRYIFSGYKTDEPLMKDGEVNPLIDTENQSMEYQIGVDTAITVNTEGMEDIFSDMKALFNEMVEVVKAVKDKEADPNVQIDPTKPQNSTELNEYFSNKLADIDKITASVSEKVSDLGSRMSRVEYTQTRLSEQKTTYKNLLSETEDVDIEETYTNFNVQYATYQSALQAVSKIITNTLADYL